ncbi:MAG TPA: helix-turn-helix transcriptional regulator [Bacteroidales bacterium]|nr:helix-turn-helix transcriptional regulator [Bacteroidales bacterium]
MADEKIIEARKLLCRYLADTAKSKGLSTYKLAAITGLHPANISRVFSGRYAPTLDTIIRLGEAIGVYFFIIDKNANDDLVTTMKERWARTSQAQ